MYLLLNWAHKIFFWPSQKAVIMFICSDLQDSNIKIYTYSQEHDANLTLHKIENGLQ